MADVLIVDDEISARKILTRWLRDAGHEAREAADAHLALAAMAERPSAVAFCDIQAAAAAVPRVEDSGSRLAEWLELIDAGIGLS